MQKSKTDNTRTSFKNNMNDLCAFRFTFKMPKGKSGKICLQDELLIVLIITMELKTFTKGYHIYIILFPETRAIARARASTHASKFMCAIYRTREIIVFSRKEKFFIEGFSIEHNQL